MIFSPNSRTTHCYEPPAWKGLWKDRNGCSHYAEACREHGPTPKAQGRVTDSMRPAAQVQAMATIKTAPVKASWVMVPQIPSGTASTSASPTAMAPASAVESRRALRSAQQGPTMSSPIKMIRDPRSAVQQW